MRINWKYRKEKNITIKSKLFILNKLINLQSHEHEQEQVSLVSIIISSINHVNIWDNNEIIHVHVLYKILQ